jgi:ketosteroid isomerase-like protein
MQGHCTIVGGIRTHKRLSSRERSWEKEEKDMRVSEVSIRCSSSLLTLIMLLVLTSCQGTSAAKAAEEVTFDVDRHIAAWVSLWNTYELSKVDELFLTDDRVTYFSSEKEGLIRGIEALREHHQGFGFVEGGKPAEKELWMEELQSDVFGSTAVVTGIWYFGSRADDRDKIQHGPVTFVYAQEGEEFKLAHLHFANY